MSKPIAKSTAMLLLERIHRGKAIEQIVEDACRKHERPEAVAAELGVSANTLRAWKRRFEISDKN